MKYYFETYEEFEQPRHVISELEVNSFLSKCNWKVSRLIMQIYRKEYKKMLRKNRRVKNGKRAGKL